MALGRDFAACKPDGSLRCGIEIVTAPAEYSVHKKRWRKFFDDVPEGLSAKKNCGLHVHLSREPLGPIVVGRLAVFTGNPFNRCFVNTIARRKRNSYAKIWQKSIEAGGHRCTDRCFVEHGHRESPRNRVCTKGRYEALNLTPEKTIEFRIFASTTQGSEFFASLGFVESLRKFLTTLTDSHRYRGRSGFAHTTYCRWLGERKDEYPELIEFLSNTKFAAALAGKATPVITLPSAVCTAA